MTAGNVPHPGRGTPPRPSLVPGATPFSGGDRLESARARHARRLAGRHDALPALNRFAELAARLLGTSSAQVSLVADVQTVVGGTGAAAPAVGQDSAAEDSLCSVTVKAGAPVRVLDAPLDERVRRLPPVTSGVVGAYLGVPLVVSGHTVGALCVFDESPRTWSDQDVELLELLATPVVAELELAGLEADYEDDRVTWQLAVDAAGVGAYDWDLVTGELRWDERLLDLFGLDRASFGGTIDAFTARVHPEDSDRVGAVLQEAITTCGRFAAEYRVVLPTGDVRWISARGQVLAGRDGTAVRMLGAAYDTTAVQEGEARVARVLEAMPTAFFHMDSDWRLTYVNEAARRLVGETRPDIIGRTLWELYPEAVGSEFEVQYRRAVTTGEPVAFDAYYPPPLDAWYEVHAWPTPDGLSVYFNDVTVSRAAQQTLEHAAKRAALLGEVTEALTGTLDVGEAVARLAQMVVPAMADWCVITLSDGSDPTDPHWRRRLRDVGWWHADPACRGTLERYAEVRIASLADASYHARALSSAEPVVVEDAAGAIASVLLPGEAQDLARELAPASAVILPLRGRSRTSGLMTVYRGADRSPVSAEELDVLTEIAGRAGLALDNARLYTEQRDLAEGLQRHLLTAPPEPANATLAVRYEPASDAAQIGGDWYDAFVQPEGPTMVVIGDVVGHDTAAAAAMGQVRNLLRGIAVATGDGPAGVLRRVDAAMAALEIETTATAVVARLEQNAEDAAAGVMRLRWSNAGHPPPLVAVPGSTDIETLDGEGPDLLLGLLPTADRAEPEVLLPRGATLLLYTDGLVERRGQALDEGIDQLRSTFGTLVQAGLGIEDICDELLTRCLPQRPEDDVALVVVRVDG